MLFARVAKNMLQTFTKKPEHELASAKHLLENCVKLLDTKLHPELVTSAYYLLSELHLFGCIATDMESTSEAANEASNIEQDQALNIVSNHESILLPSVTSNVCPVYNERNLTSVRYTWMNQIDIFTPFICSLVTNLITSFIWLNWCQQQLFVSSWCILLLLSVIDFDHVIVNMCVNGMTSEALRIIQCIKIGKRVFLNAGTISYRHACTQTHYTQTDEHRSLMMLLQVQLVQLVHHVSCGNSIAHFPAWWYQHPTC